MCILQPCENPTGVGVWWRDDSEWCLYGQAHATSIRSGVCSGLSSVDLGTIASTVHPQGARYTADLNKMEQVALSSGQRRQIKIVDGPAAPPQQQIARPPRLSLQLQTGQLRGSASARVHYRDSSGQLVQYDQDIADALLRAVVSTREPSLVLQDTKSPRLLHFDLDTMEQSFVEGSLVSGEPLRILPNEPPRKVIIEVPWDPDTMLNLVRKAEGTMRRKILVMTVDRFRSEEHLNATLPAKAHPRIIVSKKADLQSFPGNRSFEEFVDALEDNLSACPKAIESFIKLTMPGNDGEQSRVQMAFKPIERRKFGTKKMAFWRNMAAPIAAAHALVCGTAILQIVAYLVILPAARGEKESKCWLTCHEQAEVVICRPDHCLSLAQLCLR